MSPYEENDKFVVKQWWKTTLPETAEEMSKDEYEEAVDESFHRCVCGESDSSGMVLDLCYNNPLIDSMAKTFGDCLRIATAKNSDYAGDGDPFRNFRGCEQFGVDVGDGILVRMSDKWARLTRLAQQGVDPSVADERLEDTALDLINYAAIWLAWRQRPRSFRS